MMLLPFDTETTGLPDWKAPSDDPQQPHIVQLAALLVDDQNREIMESMDVIVRPDGWVISPEMTKIHGISQEKAMDAGIKESDAVEQFMAMYEACDLRIAHNTTFDNRIIRIALKRHFPDLVSDKWKDPKLYFCTWMACRTLLRGSSGHTLAECCQILLGRDITQEAHSAMPDTLNTLDLYYDLLKRESNNVN